MKKILILCTLVLLFMIPTVHGYEQRVFDDADLLTNIEEKDLENRILELEEKYNIEIACVTTDDTNGKSAMVYAEDFYDERFGNNGMLFLIDMDNREIYATYTGTMIKTFSDKRKLELEDNAYEHISSGEYAKTFEAYLDGAHKYLKIDFPTIEERIVGVVVRSIVILPISIIIAYIMMKIKTKKGRKFERKDSYRRPLTHTIDMISDQEVMVHTETSKVYVPPRKSSSSGGRSGGSSSHRSSSGRSHSGSGRKF